MSCRPAIWPQTNSELLPKILFKLAAQFPDATYAEYPISDTLTDGYRKITFNQVTSAVHEIAWWIEEHVGKPATDDGSGTLVYMGPNDLRYTILVLGSVMVGYKMLFPTPRYGVESTCALVSLADGSVILMPSEPDSVALTVAAKNTMLKLEIPSIEHLLAARPEVYPYTKTFKTSKHEPLVCLHTSGTTGSPKPVIWTHDWADSAARGHYLPVPAGHELSGKDVFVQQKRIMSLFPQMHASGMITALIFPIYLGIVMIHPPSRLGLTDAVNAAIEALEYLSGSGKVDGLALPPPHAQYLGANSALTNKVRKLAGTVMIDRVDAHTVHNEFQYFCFHPALNIRFDALSEGEEGTLYEATVVKNEGENVWVQPIFKALTEISDIKLGDLFVRHPYDPDKWKHAGRTDDMLTFLGSEKYYPSAAERRITSHQDVLEAVVAGTLRPKASLIVRLQSGADIDSIWNAVDRVNWDVPIYARIAKHMIVVATEPFPRTAKGSIQGTATLQIHESQLSALYEKDGNLA